MDLMTAIDARASAARLTEPAPSPEHLDRILRAGARAPDHGRLAPWRFVVLEGSARDVLADAMASAKLHKYPDSGDADLIAERSKAMRAPTIVAVAARVDPAHKVPEIEQILAVGAAVENMILAAHALGYGTMWKTGPAAYDPIVKTALGLESADSIVAFLYLGTAAVEGRRREVSLDGRVRRF
jgi:nitroreductase